MYIYIYIYTCIYKYYTCIYIYISIYIFQLLLDGCYEYKYWLPYVSSLESTECIHVAHVWPLRGALACTHACTHCHKHTLSPTRAIHICRHSHTAISLRMKHAHL